MKFMHQNEEWIFSVDRRLLHTKRNVAFLECNIKTFLSMTLSQSVVLLQEDSNKKCLRKKYIKKSYMSSVSPRGSNSIATA